jgi:hypothetical protein
MAAIVLLQDIVDALEMQFDELPSFLDLDTGQVETVHSDLLREAEDSPDKGPDLPGWQEQEWEIAKRIVTTDRFVKLPSKFDVHEWEIMREFADAAESCRIREELLNAIHGRGAFRWFKDTIRRYRIESAWYEFRTEALRQIALDWCEEHGISWQ